MLSTADRGSSNNLQLGSDFAGCMRSESAGKPHVNDWIPETISNIIVDYKYHLDLLNGFRVDSLRSF